MIFPFTRFSLKQCLSFFWVLIKLVYKQPNSFFNSSLFFIGRTGHQVWNFPVNGIWTKVNNLCGSSYRVKAVAECGSSSALFTTVKWSIYNCKIVNVHVEALCKIALWPHLYLSSEQTKATDLDEIAASAAGLKKKVGRPSWCGWWTWGAATIRPHDILSDDIWSHDNRLHDY